jgi:uncharacterized protein YdaT
MPKRNIHVIPHGDGWATRKEGSERVSRVTETQGVAIELAREHARKAGVEVVVHKRDGSIRDSDS